MVTRASPCQVPTVDGTDTPPYIFIDFGSSFEMVSRARSREIDNVALSTNYSSSAMPDRPRSGIWGRNPWVWIECGLS
jgi:hypothetical protein